MSRHYDNTLAFRLDWLLVRIWATRGWQRVLWRAWYRR